MVVFQAPDGPTSIERSIDRTPRTRDRRCIQAGPRSRPAHSTFSSCSRRRSNSSLIRHRSCRDRRHRWPSRPTVFASRCISCTTKPETLPRLAGPGAISAPSSVSRKSATWDRSLRDFLGDVPPLRQICDLARQPLLVHRRRPRRAPPSLFPDAITLPHQPLVARGSRSPPSPDSIRPTAPAQHLLQPPPLRLAHLDHAREVRPSTTRHQQARRAARSPASSAPGGTSDPENPGQLRPAPLMSRPAFKTQLRLGFTAQQFRPASAPAPDRAPASRRQLRPGRSHATERDTAPRAEDPAHLLRHGRGATPPIRAVGWHGDAQVAVVQRANLRTEHAARPAARACAVPYPVMLRIMGRPPTSVPERPADPVESASDGEQPAGDILIVASER